MRGTRGLRVALGRAIRALAGPLGAGGVLDLGNGGKGHKGPLGFVIG